MSVVRLHVLVEEAGPGEAAAADAARVRLDARVAHAVRLEVRASYKALPAFLTHVRPFPCMGPHVVPQ